MTNIRGALPVGVSFNARPRYWTPARWWCPEKAYFRLGPAVVSIPRWLWPSRKDGFHKCANCGRVKFIADHPRMTWCRDCSLLARQLRHMLDGPSFFLDSLRRFFDREGAW